jgi:hypothetical protein
MPVLSGSILRAGARIKVYSPSHDPRTTKVQPSDAYGVRLPFELAPTFFSDFLDIDRVSGDERRQLGEMLGVELSESTCDDLDVQIKRFVSGVALERRLPSWKQYAERLREIIAVCDRLLESARRFNDLIIKKPSGAPSDPAALSLDESVKNYLQLSGANPKIKIDLSTIRTLCDDALKTIQPLASKRGQKENINFFLFMQALFQAAQDSGARVTLPSREQKGKMSSGDRPAFFKFVRAALDLSIQKGRAAIEKADLPAPEKDEALKRLAHSRKTDGGVIEDLYRVRDAARKIKASSSNRTSPVSDEHRTKAR